MFEDTDTREKVAHSFDKDVEDIDFQLLLTDNYYVNANSIHLCFPMKIKNSSYESTDIDEDMVTVNNVFGHSIKEIRVTKYGSNK